MSFVGPDGTSHAATADRSLRAFVRDCIDADLAELKVLMVGEKNIARLMDRTAMFRRQRAVAKLVGEALSPDHRLHQDMRAAQAEYIDIIAGALRDPAAPATSADSVAVRATRGWSLWQGVLLLSSLVPEYPSPTAFAAEFSTILYGGSLMDDGELLPLAIADLSLIEGPLDSRHVRILTSLASVLGKWDLPQSLAHVSDILCIPEAELIDVFGTFDDLELEYHIQCDRRMFTSMTATTSSGMLALFGMCDWVEEQLADERSGLTMTVVTLARASRRDALQRFHADRARWWFHVVCWALQDMADNGELREGINIERSAYVLQALMVGLIIRDVYEPGSIDVAQELRHLVSSWLDDPEA